MQSDLQKIDAHIQTRIKPQISVGDANKLGGEFSRNVLVSACNSLRRKSDKREILDDAGPLTTNRLLGFDEVDSQDDSYQKYVISAEFEASGGQIIILKAVVNHSRFGDGSVVDSWELLSGGESIEDIIFDSDHEDQLDTFICDNFMSYGFYDRFVRPIGSRKLLDILRILEID
jgi:hypothetical protein